MGGLFDVEERKARIIAIEEEMNKPNFWDNIDEANKLNKELTTQKKEINLFNKLDKEINDNNEVVELLEMEPSDELQQELEKDVLSLDKELEELEIDTYMSDEYSNSDCYLEIHPGAGGTESCDWASMLLRMYERFCDKMEWTHEVIEKEPGEEAGLKSVTVHVKGEYAYGYLKHEKGVISMARTSVKDSASTQFFICTENAPHLDNEYAAFGKVVKGFDTLDYLDNVNTEYVSPAFSDFPYPIVRIKTIKQL